MSFKNFIFCTSLLATLTLLSCGGDSSEDTNENIDNPLNDGQVNSNNDSNKVDYVLPKITTEDAQRISTNEAILSGFTEGAIFDIGDVVDEGKVRGILTKGILWGTTEQLVFENDQKLVSNSDLGGFSFLLDGLEPNTTYFFQAYATNADNEIGLGLVKSFTTQNDMAPCTHDIDNRFPPIFNSYETLNIDNVELKDPIGFNDGNIEFEASSSNSIVRIKVQLNEINKGLPKTGTYKGVFSFDNQSLKSNNEVKVIVQDFNGFTDFFPQGGRNNTDTEIYIENKNNKVSFIFCNTQIGQYNLNGQFTYLDPLKI